MTQITAPGPETTPGPPPTRPARRDRRGIFARIGAVTVAVAAASVLKQQQAQAAPACCYGAPSCNGNCVGAAGCCWYCCLNSYLFKCCDKYVNGQLVCICAFSVGRC